MSAFVVITRERTLDTPELAANSKDLPATLSGHEVKILTLNGSQEDLEGPSTEGTVILEFSNTEAAKAWYNGSPYREVRESRFKGALYRVTLIEGVRSQQSQARHWVEFVGAV